MRRTVARLLAPALLIAVAAVQSVAVWRTGLSTWRGGGMGMYADFHPNQTRVFAWRDGLPIAVDGCEAEHWRTTRMTSEVEAVRDCLDADRVVAFRPAFDPETMRWTLEEIDRAER